MIVLWAASMYLFYEKKNYWITAVPATFMSAVSSTYFLLGNECLGRFLNHTDAAGKVVYNTADGFVVLFTATARIRTVRFRLNKSQPAIKPKATTSSA